MKANINLCLLTITSLTFFTAALAADPQVFRLAVSTPHETVKAGEAITLFVTLTNVGSRTISLSEPPGPVPAAEVQNAIEAKDSKGHPAVRTEYGRIFAGDVRPAGSRVAWKLQPSESLKETCDLAKLFVLRQPDTYTISASRVIPNHPRQRKVTSNVITITVTK